MIVSLLIAHPQLVEVPGKWEICWHMEMPVLCVFSICQRITFYVLFPLAFQYCVTHIDLNFSYITGPGDELDVSIQSKS